MQLYLRLLLALSELRSLLVPTKRLPVIAPWGAKTSSG